MSRVTCNQVASGTPGSHQFMFESHYMKPWVVQSFLNINFDSMDRTLKCDHSLESSSAVHYCVAVCFSILPGLYFWKIYQFWTWHCQE